MLVKLKPLFQSDVPDIRIEDTLFAIGRTEQPFAGYEKSLISRLSKRHAKIFEQDERVYLADLGSRNGTTCNGETVAQTPRRLFTGDEIQVGGLHFRVALDESAPIPRHDIKLMLSPLHSDQDLGSIVVTDFPFLVHRGSEVFNRYLETAPDQVEFISTRHAHIFHRGNGLCVEDLGSTNGTLLNGVMLQEHACELNDGDTIAFGGDYFIYKARVVISSDTEDETVVAEIDEIEESTGTLIVNSATSFIDVFLTDPSPSNEAQVPPPIEPQAPKAREAVRTTRSRSLLWSASAIGFVAALGGGYIFFAPPSTQDLWEMFDRGDFGNVATAANDRLTGTGDDPELVRIATMAALHTHVPTWMSQFRLEDVEGARGTIATMKALGVNNPRDDAYIELLEWAVDSRSFLGGASPMNAAWEEDELIRLISWWRADIDDRSKVLDELTAYVPGFEATRRRILAQVRMLMVQELELDD